MLPSQTRASVVQGRPGNGVRVCSPGAGARGRGTPCPQGTSAFCEPSGTQLLEAAGGAAPALASPARRCAPGAWVGGLSGFPKAAQSCAFQ